MSPSTILLTHELCHSTDHTAPTPHRLVFQGHNHGFCPSGRHAPAASLTRQHHGGGGGGQDTKKLQCILDTLSIFYKSHREKKSRVALNFYLKVMAPGWLLYLLKYVFDMTFSYPKPSFPRVTLHRGCPYMTSAKFSGFWTPSPPVRIRD